MKIPDDIARRVDLTPNAKMVYGYILTHGPNVTPDELADGIGCARWSVLRYIQQLKNAGLLQWETVTSDKGVRKHWTFRFPQPGDGE